ncbi:MAG: spermidine synthase [Candidatus Xenobium sp.]|jgi:predicted membrane-bound spermidine synthase|nr:fused MFS/spermidine synthase [Burkholderiales bacterium]
MKTAGFPVFAAAALVMALEVCGPRLLAPAFGNGTLVWSVILACTLLAMGAGNLLGGFLADRSPWQVPLRLALMGGALSSILTALLTGPVSLGLSDAFSPQPSSQLSALFLACGLLFGPPAILLAAVYPLAFRGALAGVERAGRTVGALYAFSALGSLLGALAPPLWGIEVLGTRDTLWAFAMLPLLAAIGWPALVVAGLLLVGSLWPRTLPPGVLERWESPLASYVLEGDQESVQLRVEIPMRPVLSTHPLRMGGNTYHEEMLLAWGLLKSAPPSRILSLGLGGGTIARLAREAWPQAEIHGVELDPSLLERTWERFGLGDLGIQAHLGDARAWLRRLPGTWDLVLVDVSVGATPPAHLSSREFMTEVREHLSPDGMLVVYAPPPLNVRLLGSVQAAFPQASMLERVVVGSRRPLDPNGPRLLAKELGWVHLEGRSLKMHLPPPGAPLTDDQGDFPWWWGMQ